MGKIINEIKEISMACSRGYGVDIQNPIGWTALLGLEVGEVHKSILEDDLESDIGLKNHRLKLLKVASVAILGIENIDNKQKDIENPRNGKQLEFEFPD